jgi:hypothetical protein
VVTAVPGLAAFHVARQVRNRHWNPIDQSSSWSEAKVAAAIGDFVTKLKSYVMRLKAILCILLCSFGVNSQERPWVWVCGPTLLNQAYYDAYFAYVANLNVPGGLSYQVTISEFMALFPQQHS